MQNLCTACGTCCGICPENAISMVIDKSKQYFVPQVDGARCDNCGLCLKTCPGYEIDFKSLNNSVFGTNQPDLMMGSFINCYTGYSCDEKLRYNSASGGLITTLLCNALENNLIQGALVTRMSKVNPLIPEVFLARDMAGIAEAAKSKYCPVPANIIIEEVLKSPGKYAVVGLPCHIHGIRKAEMYLPKLRDKIFMHIGLICGHTPSFYATEYIIKKYGVPQKDIVKIDYRGEGWPGCMTIQLRSNELIKIPYGEVAEIFGRFFYSYRCLLCYDQMNELADIAFGDAWLAKFDHDNLGTSIIISRTRKADDLLKHMFSDGIINIHEIPSRQILASQNNVFKKKCAQICISLMKYSGEKYPMYNYPKIKLTFIIYIRTCKTFFNWIISSHKCLHPLIPVSLFCEHLLIKLLKITDLHSLVKRNQGR